MTTQKLNRLRDLIVHDGYSLTEAAEELKITYMQALYWRNKLELPHNRPHMHNRKHLNCYAAYDRNTDELICIGTVEEVATACHVKPNTMRSQMCRDNGRYQFIKIEND